MKFKITYYDIETNKQETKTCERFTHDQLKDYVEFCPVDDPVKSYKTITINSPKIETYQWNDNLRIIIKGYQFIKNKGYWPTETVLENINE